MWARVLNWWARRAARSLTAEASRALHVAASSMCALEKYWPEHAKELREVRDDVLYVSDNELREMLSTSELEQ